MLGCRHPIEDTVSQIAAKIMFSDCALVASRTSREGESLRPGERSTIEKLDRVLVGVIEADPLALTRTAGLDRFGRFLESTVVHVFDEEQRDQLHGALQRVLAGEHTKSDVDLLFEFSKIAYSHPSLRHSEHPGMF